MNPIQEMSMAYFLVYVSYDITHNNFDRSFTRF